MSTHVYWFHSVDLEKYISKNWVVVNRITECSIDAMGCQQIVSCWDHTYSKNIHYIHVFLHPIIPITVVWMSLECSICYDFKLLNIYKAFLLNHNFIILDQWSKKKMALNFSPGTYVLSNLPGLMACHRHAELVSHLH